MRKPKSAKGLRIAAARLIKRAMSYKTEAAYDRTYRRAQEYVAEAIQVEAGVYNESMEIDLELTPVRMQYVCPCCEAVIDPIKLPPAKMAFGKKAALIRGCVDREDNPFFARNCDRVYTYIQMRRYGMQKGDFYLREFDEGTMVTRTDVPMLLPS